MTDKLAVATVDTVVAVEMDVSTAITVSTVTTANSSVTTVVILFYYLLYQLGIGRRLISHIGHNH